MPRRVLACETGTLMTSFSPITNLERTRVLSDTDPEPPGSTSFVPGVGSFPNSLDLVLGDAATGDSVDLSRVSQDIGARTAAFQATLNRAIGPFFPDIATSRPIAEHFAAAEQNSFAVDLNERRPQVFGGLTTVPGLPDVDVAVQVGRIVDPARPTMVFLAPATEVPFDAVGRPQGLTRAVFGPNLDQLGDVNVVLIRVPGQTGDVRGAQFSVGYDNIKAQYTLAAKAIDDVVRTLKDAGFGHVEVGGYSQGGIITNHYRAWRDTGASGSGADGYSPAAAASFGDGYRDGAWLRSSLSDEALVLDQLIQDELAIGRDVLARTDGETTGLIPRLDRVAQFQRSSYANIREFEAGHVSTLTIPDVVAYRNALAEVLNSRIPGEPPVVAGAQIPTTFQPRDVLDLLADTGKQSQANVKSKNPFVPDPSRPAPDAPATASVTLRDIQSIPKGIPDLTKAHDIAAVYIGDKFPDMPWVVIETFNGTPGRLPDPERVGRSSLGITDHGERGDAASEFIAKWGKAGVLRVSQPGQGATVAFERGNKGVNPMARVTTGELDRAMEEAVHRTVEHNYGAGRGPSFRDTSRPGVHLADLSFGGLVTFDTLRQFPNVGRAVAVEPHMPQGVSEGVAAATQLLDVPHHQRAVFDASFQAWGVNPTARRAMWDAMSSAGRFWADFAEQGALAATGNPLLAFAAGQSVPQFDRIGRVTAEAMPQVLATPAWVRELGPDAVTWFNQRIAGKVLEAQHTSTFDRIAAIPEEQRGKLKVVVQGGSTAHRVSEEQYFTERLGVPVDVAGFRAHDASSSDPDLFALHVLRHWFPEESSQILESFRRHRARSA
ncbi:MAG: hypothetical protein AAGJ56_01505 [Myxococcota bacterium]